MNDKARRLGQLINNYPELKGNFTGFKHNRGGMGISRIDNDWYECDEYYLAVDDLVEFISVSEEAAELRGRKAGLLEGADAIRAGCICHLEAEVNGQIPCRYCDLADSIRALAQKGE